MSEAYLTIDPRRQFGRVCIAGTRITAETIAGMIAAGDGVDETAKDYGITREQVLVACWWWVDANPGRSKHMQRVREAWGTSYTEGTWHYRASRVLGGREDGPLDDPPEVPR